MLIHRLNRNVTLSPSGDHAVVWWSASDQEVFPWAPNLREEDRANVMLFSLKNGPEDPPRRLGFLRTHSNPVSFRFAQPEMHVPPEAVSGSAPSDCVLHYLGLASAGLSTMFMQVPKLERTCKSTRERNSIF